MDLPEISNKTILISPLDWGFGHTTRCVSIIKALLINNNSIIFAGNLAQVNFIKNEFSEIKIELIEGYNVELSSKKSAYSQILNQLYKINKAIGFEFKWVKNYIEKHNVDLIISDNRYGFRSPKVESIFIGHQLNLELPKFKKIVNSILIKKINQFNKVWIVDDEKINLAGKLSNPKELKIPYCYIGLLSRFTAVSLVLKYDYLILVSGPVPENTLFLKEVELFASQSKLKIAIVSTVKSANELINVDYYYYPTTGELNTLLNSSKTIISKAGYTTLMELLILYKNAVLIPTKGQFEQEYLALSIKNDRFKFVENIDSIR